MSAYRIGHGRGSGRESPSDGMHRRPNAGAIHEMGSIIPACRNHRSRPPRRQRRRRPSRARTPTPCSASDAAPRCFGCTPSGDARSADTRQIAADGERSALSGSGLWTLGARRHCAHRPTLRHRKPAARSPVSCLLRALPPCVSSRPASIPRATSSAPIETRCAGSNATSRHDSSRRATAVASASARSRASSSDGRYSSGFSTKSRCVQCVLGPPSLTGCVLKLRSDLQRR